MSDGFELPDGLTPEEERQALLALEHYLHQENPRPAPWVLAARLEATGQGALQSRRLAEAPWGWPGRVAFARRGVASLNGRGDAG